MKSHPKFELTLRFKSEALVKTPREAQRSWLISQLLAEMEDDLLHLDDVARAMVGGAPDFDGVFRDISRASLSEQEIMEDWQLPIMKAMARHVTESHGDVLEIGFGRGTSATFIQELGVRSHTIVEANELTIQNHFEPWRERFPDPRVRLIAGKWQDVLDRLSVYDGVFFHAVPLDEDEFIRNMLNGITFAEHFFPFAAERLRKGGTFTYLTTEIDSMSRRHQRALFKHFSSLTLSVEPLSVPSDTKDAWWVNSMVIVKAVK